MKKLIILVASFVLFSLPALANIKQVTGVAATAVVVVVPGAYVKTIIIQNNGSGNVRLTIDGGSTAGGNNPTATTGYKLVAGTFIVLTYTGTVQPPAIKAILESATTTTLDIITDDTLSTFPTS